MAEPSLLYAKEPNVPIQLFPEAMQTGAAVGNAVKTPLQALAEGATNAISGYQNTEFNAAKIQGQELQNQKTQQEMEMAPAKQAADIAAAQARAQYEQSIAEINGIHARAAAATQEYDIAKQKAEAQAAEMDATNKVNDLRFQQDLGTAIQNKDVNKINDLIKSQNASGYMFRNAKDNSGIFATIPTDLPGIDNVAVKSLSDYARRRQIQVEMLETKAKLQGPMETLRAKTLSDSYMKGLVTSAKEVTGDNSITNDMLVSGFEAYDTGKKKVVNGRLITLTPDEYSEVMPAEGGKERDRKDVFFKDVHGTYYQLDHSVLASNIKDIEDYSATSKYFDGTVERSLMEAAFGAPPAAAGAVAPAAPTGPKVPSPFPKGSAGTGNVFQTPAKQLSSAVGSLSVSNVFESNPETKTYVGDRLGFRTMEGLNANLPIVANYINEVKSPDAIHFWSGKSADLHAAEQELARSLATDDYRYQVAKNPDFASISANKYGEVALQKYQENFKTYWDYKNNRFGTTPGVATMANKLAESGQIDPAIEAKTPEDLYYIDKRKQFDDQVTKASAEFRAELTRENQVPTTRSAFSSQYKAGQGMQSTETSTYLTPAQQAAQQKEKKSMTPEEAKILVNTKADKYGVPRDIATALVQQESSFDPEADAHINFSNSHAYGLMQLQPGTAKKLGVDPRVPEQNVEGGMKLLSQLYKKLGNWKDAMTAYHDGLQSFLHNKGVNPNSEESMNYAKSILKNVG